MLILLNIYFIFKNRLYFLFYFFYFYFVDFFVFFKNVKLNFCFYYKTIFILIIFNN